MNYHIFPIATQWLKLVGPGHAMVLGAVYQDCRDNSGQLPNGSENPFCSELTNEELSLLVDRLPKAVGSSLRLLQDVGLITIKKPDGFFTGGKRFIYPTELARRPFVQI